MEKNIYEFNQAHDGLLHGYVTVTETETGKILVQKHNMIVETGRNLIINNMFGTTNTNTKVDAIYFGKGTKLTTPNMTYNNDVSDNVIFSMPLSSVSSNINNDTNTMEITATVSYNDEPITITEIGLLYGGSTPKLFSRVIHEPVVLGPQSSEYTVNYYVYF